MSLPLTALILAVRRRANIEDQTDFIDDPEITEELNFAGVELHGIMMQAGGQPWSYKSINFKTNQGTASYDLKVIGAYDIQKLISVDMNIGGYTMSSKPYMTFERNRYKGLYQGFFGRTGWPMFYRLQGGTIAFVPLPDSAYQVTLNYYPCYAPMIGDQDSFDSANGIVTSSGWEEFMIWKVVAYCKAKGDEDPSFAMAQYQIIKSQIEAWVATRDMENPERVHEVDADGEPWDFL